MSEKLYQELNVKCFAQPNASESMHLSINILTIIFVQTLTKLSMQMFC